MGEFIPGGVWLDTNGKRIQAHGGSVICLKHVYYWYGENKEKTDGKNGIWHWGVRCYKSSDLYNWEDCGIIIPPDTENPESPLYPENCMDRPHIIYNQKRKKFICWLKIMEKDGSQSETILEADDILGPYQIIHTGLRPLGMSAGDFDLAVAEDGKAYYYFERVHSELICADLTEDYTNVTGYYPNPSEVAVADTWHGPYRELGLIHRQDESKTSFHSQISSVFKVEGKKDLYIACADRWLPEHMDRKYENYSRIFELLFSGRRDEISPDMMGEAVIENTAIADYVWLPIFFDGDRPYIKWMDTWSLDDFA